jgi:hypothetical protein
MPRVRNPLYRGTKTGYNDPNMAAIGTNIASLLLSGDTPNAQGARESKAALDAKHGALYDAQTGEATARTGKVNAEADALRNRAAYRTVDAFRSAAKARLGYAPDAPDEAVAPEHAKEINGYVGHLLTAQGLPGNSTYDQFQHGIGRTRDASLGDDVLAGRRKAGDVAASQGAVAGKPTVDIKDHQVFSPYDASAPRQTTDVGTALVGRTNAQTKTEGERQKTEGARRGLIGAQTDKARKETTVENYTGDDASGNPQYRLDPRSVGAIVTKPKGKGAAAKVNDVSPSETAKMQSLIARRLGVDPGKMEDTIDPEAVGEITRRATQYYQQTGDTGGAIERAIKDVPLSEYEGRWFGPNKKRKSVGQLATGGGAKSKTAADLSDAELKKQLGL